MAEETEAFAVVGKIAGCRTVEAVAIEVDGMIEEIDGHPSYLPLPNVGLFDKAADRHLDADAGDDKGKARQDPPVGRHDDAHIMTELAQGLGEGAGNIGETAGLGEGGHLGGDKENFHGRHLTQSHKTFPPDKRSAAPSLPRLRTRRAAP